MRHFPPAFQLISSLRRLRDPQVQVWVMAGFSVLLVLIGHVRAWNPSGEGKNSQRSSATRLLLAGAKVEWSEEFGTATRQERRPVLSLNTPSPALRKTPAPRPALDVRPAMENAASQPWQALDRPLRQQMSQAGVPAAPLKVSLRWSGDARGNAALTARRQPALPQAAAGFVIGNGSRSGDGEIEWLSAPSAPLFGSVEITLIGTEGRTTPSQLAGLAELLVHLEALSGHPLQSAAASPTGFVSPTGLPSQTDRYPLSF